MSSFVHSPGSAIEPSPGGGVYSSIHQQQQQQQQPMSAQPLYQYMAPSPAQQQSELSRQLGKISDIRDLSFVDKFFG